MLLLGTDVSANNLHGFKLSYGLADGNMSQAPGEKQPSPNWFSLEPDAHGVGTVDAMTRLLMP